MKIPKLTVRRSDNSGTSKTHRRARTSNHQSQTSKKSSPRDAAWHDRFNNLHLAYAELQETQSHLERSAAKITETKDLFERVIECMSEALFSLDPAGRIRKVNPAACKLWQRKESELVDQLFADFRIPNVPTTPWELLKAEASGLLPQFEVEAPIRSEHTVPLGVSCTLVRDPRGKITGMLIIARDWTRRKQAEDHMRESLREKEVLLKEIHHRVKNNLQTVSSMLNLGSHHLSNPTDSQMLREIKNRIISMALIHEDLYKSGNLARINLADYLRKLCSRVISSYGADPKVIILKTKLDPVSLGIDQGVPCALMINELISNSLKYGFPDGRKGEIRVECRLEDEAKVVLIVADNGVGLPADFDLTKTDTLGLKLVNSWQRQLSATRERVDEAGSTGFQFAFAVNKSKTGGV